MALDSATVFNAVVVALLAALVVSVGWIYSRRARTIAAQRRTLPAWVRAQGFSFTADPLGGGALPPFGKSLGLTGIDRKLFEGIAASPPRQGEFACLMHRSSPEPELWVVQHRLRHGNPARSAPKTALGQAFGYTWGSLVAVALPGRAAPLLVTPRRRMRFSLWLHRRLRLRTGDDAFDREFGVLGADPEQARSVLSPELRRWLREQPVPAKIVLVIDRGVCYAARHEPLRVETVPPRMDLVTGFAHRIPGALL